MQISRSATLDGSDDGGHRRRGEKSWPHFESGIIDAFKCDTEIRNLTITTVPKTISAGPPWRNHQMIFHITDFKTADRSETNNLARQIRYLLSMDNDGVQVIPDILNWYLIFDRRERERARKRRSRSHSLVAWVTCATGQNAELK